MKKAISLILCLLILASLCTVNAFALTSSDNGKMVVISPADVSSPYYELSDVDDYGFDVQGYVELYGYTTCIGSTYGDYGYHTFLNVDGAHGRMEGLLHYGDVYPSDYADEQTEELYDQYLNGEIEYDVYREAYDSAYEEWEVLIEAEGEYDLWEDLSAMAYNCAGSLVQTIDGLELKLENSYSGNGNHVKISYTVTNPGSTEKTFSLATTADVQVSGDDRAALRVINDGYGAKLVADDDCMFVLDGSATELDNIWVGHWGTNYFKNMFDDSENDAIYDDGDSAICWSWTNRTLAAGESASFYVLIEVGINEGPEINVDEIDANNVTAISGQIIDPNLGRVDLYYTIDGGEQMVVEDIYISDGSAPFETPVSFDCGSSHTIELWAIDDEGAMSDKETVYVEVAHLWGVPEVTEAPTVAHPGTVLYTCERCGETKTESIYIGDSTGDGVVNSLDAALILKYDAGIITDLTPLQLMLCDTNGDSVVNSLDAAAILKYDAGLITEFANADFSIEAYIELVLTYYGIN